MMRQLQGGAMPRHCRVGPLTPPFTDALLYQVLPIRVDFDWCFDLFFLIPLRLLELA